MDVEKLNSYFISIFFTYIYFQKMLDGFHDNSFLYANVRCQKTVGVGWGAVHLAPPPAPYPPPPNVMCLLCMQIRLLVHVHQPYYFTCNNTLKFCAQSSVCKLIYYWVYWFAGRFRVNCYRNRCIMLKYQQV